MVCICTHCQASAPQIKYVFGSTINLVFFIVASLARESWTSEANKHCCSYALYSLAMSSCVFISEHINVQTIKCVRESRGPADARTDTFIVVPGLLGIRGGTIPTSSNKLGKRCTPFMVTVDMQVLVNQGVTKFSNGCSFQCWPLQLHHYTTWRFYDTCKSSDNQVGCFLTNVSWSPWLNC